MLTYFIQTPDGSQFRCEETSVSGLKAFIANQLGIPEELQKFHQGGKPLTSDAQITDLCTITLFLGLQGGKGGFGSLLKNQAQTRRKIINWDQSRDREGRRIINFKNENNLIDYYMNKQDEQKKIQEQKQQVEIQQATMKANENHIKLDQAYVRKNQQNEKIIENSIKQAIASKSFVEKKVKQKKVNLDLMDEIDQIINEPELEKKVKLYNNHVRYYSSSQHEDKKYKQLFEAYFDPFIEDKKHTYLRILKKNKSVRFATRAFVFTAPIFIGLYFLPGNQFKIQIEIKKFVRRSIIQLYKFLTDYSENTYKETCQRNYITSLNNSYYYFEDQEIIVQGQFQEIIEEYILILNENPKLIEFALLHIDQLFARILDNHRYHYFIENSSLLIDLLDMIKICLPKIEQKELELKYQVLICEIQFETMKIQPITTLICALLQYSQNLSERVEVYKYAIQILAKCSVISIQLKNQMNLILPIIYRDLAKQDDELNINAMNFLIGWQKSLQQSDVINALLKDQLYSNLLAVLNRKSETFQQQFKALLQITSQNKEICYLLKETMAFDQEKQRLKNTKTTKEFENMISTFSIHSRKSRSKQKQTQGLLMKGVTARQNANLKIWLNEIMNRKEVDLKLGKLDFQKQKQFKSNPSQNELILPSVFRGVQESQIFPMICFQKRTCRELIREIRVQENIQSLPPDDRRNGIFCGLIRELFHEIELTDQNILICKNPITSVFYIYFSDCQVCPISKCCYTSVVIVLAQSFGGQIKCNNEQCPLRVLATFEIQEDLFWKKKINDLSTKISKFVVSGKCRTKSLKSSIQPKENVQTTRRKKLKNSSITDVSECN